MMSAATPCRWSQVVLTATAVLLLAGCSGRTGDQVNEGSSTSSIGPTTTGDPRPAILAAYRAHWADVLETGKTADWHSPRLDDHATGETLQTVRDSYRKLQSDGEVVRGTVRLHPRVTSVRGSTAIVHDCNDATDFLRYDAKTGVPKEERKTDVVEAEVTLRVINGTWKVSSILLGNPCRP
jgi:hypothetical protein